MLLILHAVLQMLSDLENILKLASINLPEYDLSFLSIDTFNVEVCYVEWYCQSCESYM